MSLAYIRDNYGVPAEEGGRVIVDGMSGTIVGAQDAHLMVQFDGCPVPWPAHPTWHVTYGLVRPKAAA